ncbi:hypothetical protein [Thermophilibacter sp.]
MSRIKSLAVGEGDFYYVRGDSDNFTIIDCCLSEDDAARINHELCSQVSMNDICRFVSTHPDKDHFLGIELLDKRFSSQNFYCVDNEVKKSEDTDSFRFYCELRSGESKCALVKGLSRCWFTRGDNERGRAGFQVLWPDVENDCFKDALKQANSAPDASPNNISAVLRYELEKGPSFLWAGDLRTEFMDQIADDIELTKTTVVFAPHHGRATGKLPASWLERLDPDIIVVGEAPSEELEYYGAWNTLTQNTAGDILFDCASGRADIYVSSSSYTADFLDDCGLPDEGDLSYLGTLRI